MGASERRPAFSSGYPRDAELDALAEAFGRGDYARVRREAPALAERAQDPAVKAAARELRARIEPDPWAVRLMALTAALLIVVTAYWVLQHGATTREPTLPPVPPPMIERP